VAVKVTLAPEQILVELAEIPIVGVSAMFTTIVMPEEVTTEEVTQEELLVNVHVITSPFANVAVA
jgi:hypothetical protein